MTAATPKGRRRALVLTVGTGDLAHPEESLFRPLRLSMRDGRWERIVLLPSRITHELAEELCAQCDDLPIVLQPLPEAGMENDPDACFAEYVRVLSELKGEGFPPQAIVVDFTRGTKAMSAALVLAAVRHDIGEMRYITGERDTRGMVVAGTERIEAISATVATAQKQLDTACAFVRQGNFAAALETLPRLETPFAALWPPALAEIAARVRPWLDFYNAWDRFDYEQAAAIAAQPSFRKEAPAEWRPFAPTDAMLRWVRDLAEAVDRKDFPGNARRLRPLMVDLLANGERRIRDRQFEDALLRAYRVLELVGQARLFDRGYDSACIPPDDPRVRAFDARMRKKKSASFGLDPGGKSWTAPRMVTARFLKHMGDPLAKSLIELGGKREKRELGISDRNHSILIHGFYAVGPKDEKPMRELYCALEKLILADQGAEGRERLKIARALDFSSRA